MDHFSRNMWELPLVRYRLNQCSTESTSDTEHKAVFLPVIIKCVAFHKNTLNATFGGTPLQKETKMFIVAQRVGLRPLTSHCMKPAPFDVVGHIELQKGHR